MKSNFIQLAMLVQVFIFLSNSSALAQSLTHLDHEQSILNSVTGKERADLRSIIKNEGPIIDMEASGLNATKSFMEEVGDRLSKVMAAKYGDSHHYETEIFLIENKKVNAFVYQAHKFTQNYSQSYVMLTTGLLEAILNTKIKGSLSKIVDSSPEMRTWAIAGVIAHEMSHPIDNVQNQDYQQRGDGAGHMSEFVADLSPVEYLKKANMPPEAMLTTLAILAAKKPKDANVYQNFTRAILAAVSTHPTTNLRLSLVNGAVTIQRVNEGDVKIIPTKAHFNKVQKEIKSIASMEKNAVSLNLSLFRKAKTSLEAIDKMIEVIKDPIVTEIEHSDYLLFLEILSKKIQKEGRSVEVDGKLTELFTTLISSKFIRKKIKNSPKYYNDNSKEADQVKDYFNFLSETPSSMKILKAKIIKTPQWKETSADDLILELDSVLPKKVLLNSLDKEILKKLTVGNYIELIKYLAYHEARPALQLEVVKNINKNNSPEKNKQAGKHPDITDLGFNRFKKLFNTKDFAQTKYDFEKRVNLYAEKYPEKKNNLALEIANGFRDVLRKESFSEIERAISRASIPEVIHRYIYNKTDWPSSDQDFDFASFSKDIKYAIRNNKTEFSRFLKVESQYSYLAHLLNSLSKDILLSHKQVNSIFDYSLSHYKDIINKDKSTQTRMAKLLAEPVDAIRVSQLNPVQKRMLSKSWDLLIQAGHTPVKSFKILVEKKYNSKTFKNPTEIVKFVNGLYSQGLIDTSVKIELLEKIFYAPLEKIDHKHLVDILSHKPSAKKYYYDFIKPESIKSFLSQVQEVFKLEKIVKNTKFKDHGEYVEQFKNGQIYATEYYRIFESFIEEMTLYYQNLADTNPDLLIDQISTDFATEKIQIDFKAAETNPGSAHFSPFLKKILSSISFDHFTYQQKLKFWEQVSRLAPNVSADEFFTKHLLKDLKQKAPLSEIEEALKLGRIDSDRLGAELTKVFIENDLSDLEKKEEISNRDLRILLIKIESLLPNTSPYKDKVLDDISWRLELSLFQSNAYIEPSKSFNWKLIPPNFLKRASFLDRLMPIMTTVEKRTLLAHIRNPEGSLWDKLPRIQEGLKKASSTYEWTGDETSKQLMDNIDKIIRGANFSGRIALIQQVLGSPQAGLWWENDVEQKKIIANLNIESNSAEEALLMAYLKAAPKNETTVTLSYLLATEPTQNESIDLLKVLELFPPFGVKFGQMASILNLFGPEHSERLRTLKDNSNRPSLTEAYKMVKEVLPEEAAKNIKIKSVLGSASLKLVLLVEKTQPDGNIVEEALVIKRPFTKERLESSFRIITSAVEQLKKNPKFSKKYDFKYLLERLKVSVDSELDFTVEVKNYEKIRALYKGKNLNGWQFEVPNVNSKTVNEDFFSMDAIKNSIPINDLSPSDKENVSDLILQTELEFLFETGQFDADRHSGNYLIDPESKKIFVIDPGQFHQISKGNSFKEGQLTQIGLMFLGLNPSNPSYDMFVDGFTALIDQRERTLTQKVLSYIGLSQALKKDKSSSLKSKLLNDDKLKKQFFEIINDSERSVSDQMTELIGIFGNKKAYLPQEIIFGFLKSFVILSNEDYAKSEKSQDYIFDFVHTFVKKRAKQNLVNGSLKYSDLKNIKTNAPQKRSAAAGGLRCSAILGSK